jgi:hypothetical protein
VVSGQWLVKNTIKIIGNTLFYFENFRFAFAAGNISLPSAPEKIFANNKLKLLILQILKK